MMRYLKALLFSVLVIGLMSGSAFAGAIGNATGPANTAKTISTEVIGASGLTIASGSATSGTVYYKATNAFVANDVITFTFANVALTGATFNLCIASSITAMGDYIGAIDAVSGVSSLLFRISAAGVPASTQMGIVQGACSNEVLYTTPALTLNMKFPVLANTQSATVSAGAVFGTGTAIPGATAAAVNLYTVANQFTATAAGLLSYNIDFDSDMKKFLVGSVAGVLGTGNVLALAAATNDMPYTLLVSDKVGLTLSGSMDGVSRICFDDAACLAASTKKFTINTSTNTATYDVTTVTPSITTDVNKVITFVTDGTTPLSERTYTLAVLEKLAGATTLNRTLQTADPYFRLALDAWQAKVPFVKTDSSTGAEVYVKLTSSYISTGTSANKVKAIAFCADKTTSVVDVTTITPGVSSLITGAELATAFGTCVTNQMKSDGYPVILTVNAPLANVNGYGSYVSGTNMRALPIKVKQSATATSNWDE